MEEQWCVVYVDRISGGEVTSPTFASREAALLHASDSTATVTRFCG